MTNEGRRWPTRTVTFLGAIIARLIGLNALVAAMAFGFIAEGRVSWGGLPGVIRHDWSGFAAFVSAVCAALTVVFLLPDVANWFLRRRGVALSILFAPFQLAASVFAVASFAILMTSKFGGSEPIWGAYILTIAAAFAVLYILPGAAAHRRTARAHSSFGEQNRTRSGGENAGYGIVELAADNHAAETFEERRRRLVAQANHAALPGGVRRRVRGPRPGRIRLAITLVAPLGMVGFMAIYARFFASFLPSAEVILFAETHAVTFAIYCVAVGVMCAGYCDLDITRIWLLRNRIVNFLVLPLVFGVAGHAAFLGAVAVGLPDIHALRMGGPPATAQVVVAARLNGDVRFACSHSVRVKVSRAAPPYELCGVPKDIWHSLSPGAPLFLTGIATAYGLRYHDMRL